MTTVNLIQRRLSRTFTVLIAMAFSVSVFAASPGGGPLGQYAQTGPYATTEERGGLSCTIYRPRNLEGGHPVILWGNGTGASPGTYEGGLEHWASWGFVVAAANTSNAGSGEEMLACLDYLGRSGIAGQLDFSNVGASGHSQGGGGTLMAARNNRITATAPVQPYILGLGHDTSSQYQQTAPMLLLSGSADTLAGPTLNQAPVFRRADVPIFWATLSGASHFEPVGNMGDYRGITTAWWLFQLEDDGSAAELFTGPCSVCDLSNWDVERKGL